MVKILLIEDDPLMNQLYKRILTLGGYDVEIAVDGKEGLEKARNIRPSLVFLDIMMPKMNGLEVLEKLKADSETRSIPVVMLTNLAGQQELDIAINKGAEMYIVKSEYEPKQVVEMVRQILSHGVEKNK